MTDFKEENETITLTIPTQGSIPVISISNWIIFMHRYRLSGFNWNLMWNDYKNGFGSSSSDDFWMGLDRLHLLTTSGSYRLRIEWSDLTTGYWLSIEYWSFFIENEAAGYKLHVSGYIPGDDGRVLCVRNSFYCLYYFLYIHIWFDAMHSALLAVVRYLSHLCSALKRAKDVLRMSAFWEVHHHKMN